MANLQKQFEQFHDAIRIRRKPEEKTLSDKREKILNRLSEGIAEKRRQGATIPKYRHLNQGSYPMGTGVKPLDGDYDLDVALLFEIDHDDFEPVEVKKWVLEALDGHTKDVRMREPCVTVTYTSKDEPLYHVDLAVYAEENADGKTYLARGKLQSNAENKRWEAADPEALLKLVENHLSDADDARQFRRVIRYLKRWAAVRFPEGGNARPRGIAITACALRWFEVRKALVGTTKEFDDLGALKTLLAKMRAAFQREVVDGKAIERLRVTLDVAPGNDLFERMTHTQMADFQAALKGLEAALETAAREPDTHEAAKGLAMHFGSDFPVPDKVETAKPRTPTISSPGNSG